MRYIKAVILLFVIVVPAVAQQHTQTVDMDTYNRFRIGGYGEAVAQFKDYGINRFSGTADGNTKQHRNTIAIPRFVIAGDYKFNQHWNVGAEIEFEAGGTGQALEIENTENGEYETEIEKGGEVAIEQFHLTYRMNNSFCVRVGHFIVPVGLNNAHHEPILFFGTVRPEGETSLIPNTWHETGLKVFGQIGTGYRSFNYEAMVVAGLNANGFDRNHWVQGGKQGFFEADNFTSPGYAIRFEYCGVPGLRLGASAYYCRNTAKNSDKPQTYNFNVPVSLWSVDAQYQNKYVVARGNVLSGHVGNSSQLSAKNGMLSNKSPYTRTAPVAQRAVSYGIEAGMRLKGLTRASKMPDLIPFARYEYYNAQHRVLTDQYSNTAADPRLKTSMWVVGLNYRPLPYIIVKADYTSRRIGGGKYNSENEFSVGVAFTAWFKGDKLKSNK